MAIEVRVPTILRSYTDGQKAVEGAGDTVADLLADLDSRFPGLRARLITDEGVDKLLWYEVPKAKKAPEPEEELELTGPVDLNKATFEELRALQFSAAQANRVIAYRDRLGGYRSVDDLETVPGIQREFVRKLEDRLSV